LHSITVLSVAVQGGVSLQVAVIVIGEPQGQLGTSTFTIHIVALIFKACVAWLVAPKQPIVTSIVPAQLYVPSSETIVCPGAPGAALNTGLIVIVHMFHPHDEQRFFLLIGA
jgi:uncharacterized membrane-anchored protein